MKENIFSQNSLRIAYRIGGIGLLFYFIFCGVYFLPRIIFVDASFVTTTIINTDWFCISENRYGAIATQWVPWVAAKLHLPLRTILIAYSCSFPLLFSIAYYIAGAVFQQRQVAVAFLFYLFAIGSDTHFWPCNEVHQAIAIWVIALSYFLYFFEKEKISFWELFFIPLAIIACYTHPLSILVILFCMAFYFLLFKNLHPLQKIRGIAALLMIVIIVAFKYWASSHQGYDGNKLAGINGITSKIILQAWQGPQFSYWRKAFFTSANVVGILIVSSCVLLFWQKKIKLLAFYLLSIFGYSTIVCIVYNIPITQANMCYMQSEWMCLGMIAALPLVYLLPQQFNGKWIAALVGYTCIYFFIKLLYIAPLYLARVEKLQKVITSMHQQKLTKAYVDFPITDSTFYTWGLQAETILLSSLQKKSVTAYAKTTIVNPDNIPPSQINSCFFIQNVSDFNKRYFNLSDTTTYVYLHP